MAGKVFLEGLYERQDDREFLLLDAAERYELLCPRGARWVIKESVVFEISDISDT